MNYRGIVVEIDAEIKRLQRARNALANLVSCKSPAGRNGIRKISAAGRRRIAAAQRKRWAKFRSKQKG